MFTRVGISEQQLIREKVVGVKTVVDLGKSGLFENEDEARGAFKLSHHQALNDRMGQALCIWMGLSLKEYHEWVYQKKMPELKIKPIQTPKFNLNLNPGNQAAKENLKMPKILDPQKQIALSLKKHLSAAATAVRSATATHLEGAELHVIRAVRAQTKVITDAIKGLGE